MLFPALRLDVEDESFVDRVAEIADRQNMPVVPQCCTPGEYMHLLLNHPHYEKIIRNSESIYSSLNPLPSTRQALLAQIRESEMDYMGFPNSFETGIDYIRGFPSQEEHIQFLLDPMPADRSDAKTFLVTVSGDPAGTNNIGYAVADCTVRDVSRFIDVSFDLRMLYVLPDYRSQGYGNLLVYLLQQLVESVYDHITVRSNFPGIFNLLTGGLEGRLYNDFCDPIYRHLSRTFTKIVSEERFVLDTYMSEFHDYRNVFRNGRRVNYATAGG